MSKTGPTPIHYGTRTVTLPDGLRLDCHDSAGAEYILRWIHAEIYDEKAYKDGVEELPEGAVIFDVGANYGIFSIYVSELMGEKKHKIHAFEPVSYLAAYAAQNTARYSPHTTVHRIAVGDADGSADVTYFPDCSAVSTISKPEEHSKVGLDRFDVMTQFIGRIGGWQAQLDYVVLSVLPKFIRNRLIQWYWDSRIVNKTVVKAPVKTLSTFIREQKLTRVDLIKVDVEGFEYQCLKGIEDEHWPLVKMVLVDLESDQDNIKKLLKDKGFTIKEFDSEATPYSDQTMLYAYRPSK